MNRLKKLLTATAMVVSIGLMLTISVTLLVGIVTGQDINTVTGHTVFRQTNPELRFSGTLNFKNRTGSVTAATLTDAGVLVPTLSTSFKKPVPTAGGVGQTTTVLTAAQSGGVFLSGGTSATQIYTLPTPASGLNYCFTEAGDAAGEILINGGTGVSIIGKTHGAENGTGIATATGTGIKNTAATNVKGDHVCLVSNGTHWFMTSVAGVWASQ